MRQRKLKVKSIERKRSSDLKRLKYVQKRKPRWKKCKRQSNLCEETKPCFRIPSKDVVLN